MTYPESQFTYSDAMRALLEWLDADGFGFQKNPFTDDVDGRKATNGLTVRVVITDPEASVKVVVLDDLGRESYSASFTLNLASLASVQAFIRTTEVA